MTEKAVLVVSFGTTHLDTLEKTIQAIEWDIAGRMPGRVQRRAFTSGMILRRLADREGLHIDDVPHALERLAGGRPIWKVVADPSAASFIETLRRRGWRVEKADNDVLAGIRTTAELLRRGRLVICQGCADALREFTLYCWDEKAGGDRVKKVHDHAMDDIRYFAATVAAKNGGSFFAGSVERASI